MVLQLYGWNRSSPSFVAALILYEKNVPFNFIDVDLPKGAHKNSGYTNKNPFAQVPMIDDDGFILYESRAIARYLEEKYPNQGTKLLPDDLQKRALTDQAIWAESYHFGRNGSPMAFEILNKKVLGGETDEAKVAELKKNLNIKLDIYEQILSKQKYIAGNELTLADLLHAPLSSRLLEAGFDVGEGRPNVGRWINELLARESWLKVKELLRNLP